ncbi:MAG: DNA repair protein RecO [Acidobacteria bacterium]|nr:DNA repair protein RecO [Acidobacteriota bacterium]
MALRSTEAVTLRTYPYRESDRIAVFLTRSYGKVRAIARGARLLRSRFGASLEPMSHVRLIFFEKENQELAVVNSCDLVQGHAAHRATLEGSYYCVYFSELLNEFSQEREVNERVFRLLLSVLDLSVNLPWEVRARYLETWLLRLEGVFPVPQYCAGCGRGMEDQTVYLPGAGQGALCRNCSSPGDMSLGDEERRLVLAIFSRKIAAVDWRQWSSQALKNLGQLNSKLVQYHLEKPLKSDRFLKDLDRC